MFKGKNWFGSWGMKSKQVHSLEHLKVLYTILHKNQVVNENNKHQLVETLRSIAEILIWGDQNDSSVFDFFLEKNMLSFFLKIMKQKCGSYICVQLLQTLNILFENIRDETSLYYLLSNNHVNSIIVHKFDFSDEEVMAYYISFLKTLSFKLNDHTIHFFFNEHTNDFPLYTEAIKFFNHNEKMVRIAVRTLTLNVFKVDEKSMLKFVGDHTAVPYFSNLVWFIGNHVLEIDNCLKRPIKDQQMLIKLDDLVAEHLDHLHYLNDILLLRINDLNEILTDHLLNRLLIPLYIYSLIENEKINFSNSPKKLDSNPLINNEKNLVNEIVMSKHRPKISKIVSLFLLSQVFLIISYDSLVQKLVGIIINGDFSIFEKPEFTAPHETLEESLVNNIINKNLNNKIIYENDYCSKENEEKNENIETDSINNNQKSSSKENLCNEKMCVEDTDILNNEVNENINLESKTDILEDKSVDEDENLSEDLCLDSRNAKIKSLLMQEFFKKKPFLEAIYKSFDFNEQKDDHLAIFSLSLLYAIIFNTGIKKIQLDLVLFKDKKNMFSIIDQLGSNKLIDQLTRIINLAANFDSFIRPITLELSSLLLLKLCMKNDNSNLSDHHLALIEQTKENATSIVRAYYKKDDEQIFLELFEDEYMEFKKFKINVEYLMMDANLLIPPKQLAPLILNGLHFTRRSPYSISEKTRFALRVFFVIRNLSLKLRNEPENELPLTNNEKIIMVGDTIDSANCELVHCFLVSRNQSKEEGFISLDSDQLLFMEPNSQHLGSVIVKYTANLQNVNVCLDKDDFRSLLVTIRPNSANGTQTKFGPRDLNSGLRSTKSSKHLNTNVKLLFDDYIRCKVFEQHIFKGKESVIFRKLKKIADLIDLQYDVDLMINSNNTFNNQTRSKIYLSKSQTHGIGNSNNLRTLNRHHPQSGFAIPGVAVIADNKTKNSPTTSLKKTQLLNLNSPSVSTVKLFDSNNLIQNQSNNLSNEKNEDFSSNSSSPMKNKQDNSQHNLELKNQSIEDDENIAMSDLSPKIQRKDSMIKNKILLSNDILELSNIQKNFDTSEEMNDENKETS